MRSAFERVQLRPAQRSANVLLVPPPHTLVIPPMHRSCYLSAILVNVHLSKWAAGHRACP
ncbi:hypothetical protein AZE42_06940 [Rhizopogon vesiculosus]|uniref:Uncharacterized protein n=1 Tax=Rhizopogon vesiculosus TaxID=180088 RepID=A0A1J8R022_9AGAM|nr:hypothetical protein AZE42_06940 [Rhizopogon vesiculosus]